MFAAVAAATAVVGAAVMRRWDAQAGKQVADLERARASDEWRHDEKVAELETDLEESRELRAKLEQRLRAKRAELAGLRNEHASLLRRYATAETERATALEGRRLLEIEATTPARELTAGPSAGTSDETAGAHEGDERDAYGEHDDVYEDAEDFDDLELLADDETDDEADDELDAAGQADAEPTDAEHGDAERADAAHEDEGEQEEAPAVFSPAGSQLFLRAKAALSRFDDEPRTTTAAGAADEAVEAVDAVAQESASEPDAETEAAAETDETRESDETGETGESDGTAASAETPGAPESAEASGADEAPETAVPAQRSGDATGDAAGDAAESAKPSVPAQATETAQVTETAQTAEATERAEPSVPSQAARASEPAGSVESVEASEQAESDAVAKGDVTRQTADAPREDDAEGQPEAADEHAHAAAATPARTGKPVQQPTGHFTVPTAVAVVPAAPVRRPAVQGGFDFFGTQKGAEPGSLEHAHNEDLADVAGQEALAVHKAEAESEFKPAHESTRAVGQVIDLTAHDETEQIDLDGLRSRVS
ncbi:hypothetical protein [Streptomyces mangrovisoli]|uniref:Secreted protein n=1 Tax=Streptomyces mangrovisoli TaxID=1428628 RepID=A0A1J4NTQ5_9ACTN|nr:hypothetical protein WN71_021595 [Streptomyces mangrovisoli]